MRRPEISRVHQEYAHGIPNLSLVDGSQKSQLKLDAGLTDEFESEHGDLRIDLQLRRVCGEQYRIDPANQHSDNLHMGKYGRRDTASAEYHPAGVAQPHYGRRSVQQDYKRAADIQLATKRD